MIKFAKADKDLMTWRVVGRPSLISERFGFGHASLRYAQRSRSSTRGIPSALSLPMNARQLGPDGALIGGTPSVILGLVGY